MDYCLVESNTGSISHFKGKRKIEVWDILDNVIQISYVLGLRITYVLKWLMFLSDYVSCLTDGRSY